MLYYKKYLKYKSKYLQLKNNNQIGGGPQLKNNNQTGGGPPLNNIIKNIGLFVKKSDMDNFLNPIYGFIYVNTDFVKNHKNFYIKGDTGISSFIYTYFNELIDIVQPTRLLMNKDFIKPKDIGIILGYLYCYKEYYQQLNCQLEYTKLIKKNNFNKDEVKFKESQAQEKLLNTKIKEIREMIPDKYKLPKFQLIKDLIDVIQNNIDDKQFFRSVLAILWHISNDKNDIKEYYEGINESFCDYNDKFDLNLPLINVPEGYINDIYDDNLKSDEDMDFEKALFISYDLLLGNLPIYNQEYSNYKDNEFPDCGESVIRSFINIICYNKSKKSFDLEFLCRNDASDNLITYYSVFDNFSKQTSNNKQYIFGTEMNARDAWNIVVSKLPNVTYRENKYDIAGDVDETNFLNVIRALFRRINNLNDLFNKPQYDEEDDVENEEDESPSFINISEQKNPTTININYNGNYKIIISINHYTIEAIIKEEKKYFDYSKLDEEEQKIIDILLDKKNIYEKIHETYYFIKWNKDNLIRQFNKYYNNCAINNKLYTKIFDYLYKKYKDLDDERNRINLNIFKILPESFSNKVKKYPEISNFGYTFDIHNNLIKINFFNSFNELLGYSLKTLSSLQELKFGVDYDQPLEDSLNGLTNLQELKFGFSFNKPLKNSLNELIKLQKLKFGYNFDLPLEDSLNKLTNLKQLSCSTRLLFNNHNYAKIPINLQQLTLEYLDQPIGNSLNGLTNLQQLTLVNLDQSLENLLDGLTNLQQLTFQNFDHPFGNSLNGLINLQQLTFGINFDQPLGNSLNGLINLQQLTFGSNFNTPLEDSLNGLINLQQLTFGTSFNTPLEDSLNGLINLQQLTFGVHYNKPLEDSLNGLINLQQLKFGFFFNTLLEDSLNGLINLQQLTFGRSFNKSLDCLLIGLTNLQEITLSKRYNQPIPYYLIERCVNIIIK